jgi:hypothetical protein
MSRNRPTSGLGVVLAVTLAAAFAAALSAPASGQEKAPADKDGLIPRWRFVSGKPFYHEITTETKVMLKFCWGRTENSSASTFWSEWEPRSLPGERWTLVQTMLGMKTKTDSPEWRYDSRKKGKRDATERCLEQLRGAIFEFPLPPDLLPEKVNGLQAFLQGMLRNEPPDVQQRVRALLREQLFREAAQDTFAFGPVDWKAVKRGESWKRKASLDMFPQLRSAVFRIYTYQGRQGKYDKITFVTHGQALSPSPDPPRDAPYKVKKTKLKAAIGSGVILFDRASGRLVSSVEDLAIEGTLLLDIEGNEIDMDVALRQKRTIKVSDRHPLE